jgi:hypothetical protein
MVHQNSKVKRHESKRDNKSPLEPEKKLINIAAKIGNIQ